MTKAVLQKEFDYVLARDRKALEKNSEHQHPTLHLRRLTARERFRIEDALGTVIHKTQEFRPNVGKMTEETLNAGWEGISNYFDADGTEHKLARDPEMTTILGKQRQPLSDAFLDTWSSEDLHEIADAIRNGSQLTLEDAGK